MVDYAFVATIRITYGYRYGSDEDGRDGARSAVKSGGCCAAKTISPQRAVWAAEAAAMVDCRRSKSPEAFSMVGD